MKGFEALFARRGERFLLLTRLFHAVAEDVSLEVLDVGNDSTSWKIGLSASMHGNGCGWDIVQAS